MSSEELIAGATKGTLDFAKEQVKEWASNFRNKQLSFVEHKETIESAKKLRNSQEWKVFKPHIKKEYKILFIMGLTLRQLEEEKKDFSQLTKKILKTHKLKGLHITYLVANKILPAYVGKVLVRIGSTKNIKKSISDLFDNIENKASFICGNDSKSQKTGGIVSKIRAHSPELFIISSVGGAKKICDDVKQAVMEKISKTYTSEEHRAEKSNSKRIYFLEQIEIA